MSVFTLGNDGVPRHFYSAHPAMSPEIREDLRGHRGMSGVECPGMPSLLYPKVKTDTVEIVSFSLQFFAARMSPALEKAETVPAAGTRVGPKRRWIGRHDHDGIDLLFQMNRQNR